MPSTLRGSAMSVPDEKLDAEGRQMASGTALVGLTAPETRKIEPAGLDACDDQFLHSSASRARRQRVLCPGPKFGENQKESSGDGVRHGTSSNPWFGFPC